MLLCSCHFQPSSLLSHLPLSWCCELLYPGPVFSILTLSVAFIFLGLILYVLCLCLLLISFSHILLSLFSSTLLPSALWQQQKLCWNTASIPQLTGSSKFMVVSISSDVKVWISDDFICPFSGLSWSCMWCIELKRSGSCHDFSDLEALPYSKYFKCPFWVLFWYIVI